jgi:hypothetical protein
MCLDNGRGPHIRAKAPEKSANIGISGLDGLDTNGYPTSRNYLRETVMSLFDIFRKKQQPQTGPIDVESSSFDPQAHHKVLEYLRRLWAGGQKDESFEKTALGADLRFNSLSFAELIFSISQEREIPLERIVHFLRVGIPGGGDQKIATLLERIAVLAEEFDEQQRIALLATGVVGDRQEIAPIVEPFDSVDSVVKYCTAIESLKNLDDHDAIDAEYGWVDEDPGWK